jgi:pimeloyl-ACP methyl ester carboxylesterase
MRIEGMGPAIAVMSGGFGGRFESWMPVASKLTTVAQVVLYDRGGSGESEAAPRHRDSKQIAAELHAALANAGVKAPYIIVGQSIGGIHARVFAHEFPKDVAGLVLVDPTAEDYGDRFKKARASGGSDAGRRADAEQSAMAEEMKKMPMGMQLEYESLDADLQQGREAWPLPKIPVTVLTSLHPGEDLNTSSPMIWLALHQELVKRAGAKHIVSETLGHNMQNEDPEFVAAAIRNLLK